MTTEHNTVIPNWISVNHEMPKGKCLVSYKNDAGNRITVCGAYYPKYCLESACNDEGHDYFEEDNNYYCSEGWYESIDNWDDYTQVHIAYQVTHWTLLPNPPEE